MFYQNYFYKKTMNEKEKAYIAGLLDGKDIFIFAKVKDSRRKNKSYFRYRPYLTFNTTNENVIKIFQYYYKCLVSKRKPKNSQESECKSYSVRVYTYDIPPILNDILPYLRHNKSRAAIIQRILDVKWAELRAREGNQVGCNYIPSADFYNSQENLWNEFQEVQNKKITELPEPIIISTELDYHYIAGFTDNFCNMTPAINNPQHNKKYEVATFTHTFNVLAYESLSLIKYYFGGAIQKSSNNQKCLKFSPEDSINFIEILYPHLKLKQENCKFFLKLLKYRFSNKEKYRKLLENWQNIKFVHRELIELIPCTCCNMLKRHNNYYKTNKKVNHGITYECIDCFSEKGQSYYENHKDKMKLQSKEYIKNNPEKVKIYRKSIPRRLRGALVNRLRDLLEQKVSGKSSLVGCDYNFLKEYLEHLFTEEMTWENYGNFWEIDHIKPLAYFNLEIESERKIAGHYTNLQPMLKDDNNSKSDILSNGKRGRDCRQLVETDPLFL